MELPVNKEPEIDIGQVRGMIDGILEIESGLSSWEIDFVESVEDYFNAHDSLTAKQMAKLAQIYDKKVLKY